MAASKQVQVRLNDEQIAKVDRLAKRLQPLYLNRVTASDVLRLGLDALERETAPKKSRKTG